MFNIFSKSRKKKSSSGAPKETSHGEFDELFDNWISMTGTKITGQKLQQILMNADDGYCSEQAALIDVIQEVEPVIGSHLGTRKRAALAKPWHLEGGSEKDRTEIARNLESIGFQHLRRNSLDALAHGYNASALLWAPGGAKLTGWKEVHATNVLFDRAGNSGLITLEGDKALSEWHPNQFMMHIHKTKPGIPCRGSIVRALVWYYFFKFYAIRDYARYLERFGMPFTLAKLSEADFQDDEKTSKIMAHLRSLGSNGVAVVTKATDFEHLSVPGGKAEYFDWFGYADNVYALTILGQIASSKEANGMSNGDLQSGVKDDLTVADCEAEEETYNNSIIKPLDRFRNGRETGIKMVIDSAPPEDMVQKYKAYKARYDTMGVAVRAGILTASEDLEEAVREELKLPVMTTSVKEYWNKNKGVKSPITLKDVPIKDDQENEDNKDANQVTALSDASGGVKDKNFDTTDKVISELTENTLRDLFSNGGTLEEFFEPLRAAIRKAFAGIDPDDPELEKKFTAAADEFFKEYPALYEEINTEAIEKAVSGSILASNINGYENRRNK